MVATGSGDDVVKDGENEEDEEDKEEERVKYVDAAGSAVVDIADAEDSTFVQKVLLHVWISVRLFSNGNPHTPSITHAPTQRLCM